MSGRGSRRPLRIGIDYRPAAHPPYAGIGQTVRELVAALAALDHPHELLLYTDAPLGAPPPGCRERLRTVGGRPSKVAWHLWSAADVARQAVDVYLATSSLFLPFVRADRCVVFVHDLSALHLGWAHTRKVRWLTRIALGRSVQRARGVVVNSAHTRADVYTRFRIDPRRVKVARLGLGRHFLHEPDGQARERVRQALGLPERFILAVNTLEPRKNVAGLLQAYALVKARVPHQLVVVGMTGWLRGGMAALTAEAARLGIARDVRFTGFVEEEALPAVYALADLFVMPSHFEGFGLPLVEAMAMGVPVVTSPVSAMPEIAADAALYADPVAPADIAAKMLAVLTDAALAGRLRAAGLARAAEFSWEDCARQVLEVLETACGVTSAPAAA